MAGKIKLDGTQFLEKVNNEFKITNSELKLKSTGNTIVDSSGNAVISESGGNVTLTTDEANVGSNALVVNSSGDVGVGTSSPTSFGASYKTLHFKNTSGDAIFLTESDGGIINEIQASDAGGFSTFGTRSNHPVVLKTNDTERMRIDSAGLVKIPRNTLTDSEGQQYILSYLITFGGTINLLHKTGYIGTTADPSEGYVLLCYAYDSTLKNKDMAFGRVHRQRGSSSSANITVLHEFYVSSAYANNVGSGYQMGSGNGSSLVTLTYSGVKFIALKMNSTSATAIIIDIWYGNTSNTAYTPILVSPGSVSNVSTISTLTVL